MKKKKLSSLMLNKKTISNLNSSQIKGGDLTDFTKTTGGGTLALSYCQNIRTVPFGCQSIDPCA